MGDDQAALVWLCLRTCPVSWWSNSASLRKPQPPLVRAKHRPFYWQCSEWVQHPVHRRTAIHANLRWTLGPLRYVIAIPVFHGWHHPDGKGALIQTLLLCFIGILLSGRPTCRKICFHPNGKSASPF